MALVAAVKPAAAADRQSVHSFGSLLHQLDAHSQLIPPAEEFLVKNAARISHCFDLFGSAGTAGTKGKEVNALQPREPEIVKQISERFSIDESQAGVLLKGLRRHLGEDTDSDIEASRAKDDAFWEALTAFFFEERLAVLHVLAHVLRSVDLEDLPAQEIYITIASQASQPAFAKSLLDRVAYLASTPVPSTARPFTTFWAKQYTKEQKALLELYFLLHYNKILPTGQTLLDILSLAKSTEWGLRQANEGYFDVEAYAAASCITCLMILISLECLNLERASSMQGGDLAIVPGSPPAEDSLLHPVMLSKIHSQVLDLSSSQPHQSGPLLLAWAFLLSRIMESMTSVSLPESYYEVAAEILPSDMHPRRNTGQPSANTSNQPIYQILASHALSPEVGLLPAFQALLASSLLGKRKTLYSPTQYVQSDPNVPGYLSVARSLLSVLPLLVHPSYLPPGDLDALVLAMETLYSNPAASLLRGQFWGLFEQADEEVIRGEWEILDVVRSRFPAEVDPFLRLMNALSGGSTGSSEGMDVEEKEVSQRCSMKVKEYMASLSTLTQVLPSMSPVVPLPYEASNAIDAGPLDVTSLRAIPVSQSVSVPASCQGRYVSEQDRRPVVICWDLTSTDQQGFSAWLVAGDILRQFVERRSSRQKGTNSAGGTMAVDVFSGNTGESTQPFGWDSEENQLQVVSSILLLLNGALASDPTDTFAVISLLSINGAQDVLEVLFAILDKAGSLQPVPEAVTVPCTRIFSLLLEEAPAQIWSYVRGSGVLIPLDKASATPVWGSRTTHTRSFLAQNKGSGAYAQTLATLSLIEAVIQQARSATLLDAPSVSKAKGELLHRALQWCFEGIWANFASWKYNDIEQKSELAQSLARLFKACLDDVDCGPKARSESIRSSSHLVIKNLLTGASAAYLAPLFQSVVNPGQTGLARGTIDEAVAAKVERSTEAVLELLQRLLGLSRRILPDQPTLLERVCFSHQNSNPTISSIFSASSGDFIATLFSLLQGEISAKVATAAARVLLELCNLAKDWQTGPERPSLLSHLGGIKNTQQAIEGLVAIAGDPFVDAALQLAVWDLLIYIMQAQPGLADVLIAGQNGLVQLAASSSGSSDGETAVSLAMQVLGGWKEAWELQPAVLAAALTFLCAAWEGYLDSNKRLQTLRTDSKIWQFVSEILSINFPDCPLAADIEDIDAPEDMATQIANDCYRRLAKSGAARLAALDAQYAVSTAEEGKLITDASIKCLTDLVSEKGRFDQCILEAITVSFDPESVTSTQKAFAENFRTMDLEAYQKSTNALNQRQRYDSDFFYKTRLAREHISGLAIEASESAVSNALTRIEALNLAMSRLHASSSLLGAWNDFLQVALPKVAESKPIGDAIWSSIQIIAKEAAAEQRSGTIVEELYDQRLNLLKTLLEYGSRRGVTPSPAVLPATIESVRNMLSSESMSVLASIKRQTVPFHRTAFQAAYLAFYKLAMISDKSTAVPRNQHAALLGDTEGSLSVAFAAIRPVLSFAADTPDNTVTAAEDLALIASVILQILSAPVPPRSSVWLAYCQNLDLFRLICDFLSTAPTLPAYQKMVQTLYELCTALAVVPQAAEKLALEGLVTAINNNAITQRLEEGGVRPPTPAAIGQTTQEDDSLDHAVWCSMLAAMAQLVTQLGDSAPFMENEVVAFSKLYSKQITLAYHWSANDTFTTSTLTELQNTTALLNAIVGANAESAVFEPLLRKQVNGSLALLQQLVYLLQHPNVLSTMLEPLSYEERTWLQSESSTSTDLVLSDLHKRLVAAAILQAVFKLSHIIMSLVRYTRAFTILAKDTFDWPKDRAVVQPNANVSLDEPATLGTLFDLARFCTDAVRYCSTSSATTSTTSTPSPLSAYDSGSFVELANYTLEGTLLLMTTQIALAVQQQDSIGSESRAAQRARRDLKELAADLVEEFLDKTGTGSSDSRLSEVMKMFMLRL